jgi:hypothetical protein
VNNDFTRSTERIEESLSARGLACTCLGSLGNRFSRYRIGEFFRLIARSVSVAMRNGSAFEPAFSPAATPL